MSEMSEYLQMFVDETGEQLDELVNVLLALEREPGSTEDLNEAFRLIHSIKGAAGMMGFDTITALTHHLESRFEVFRSGLAELDEPTMNLVLRCIDFLRECVRRLRDEEELQSASELLVELAALDDPATQDQPRPAAEPEPETAVSGTPSDQTTPADRAGAPADFTDDSDGYRLTVCFEKDLPLADLKARLIISRLSQVGEIVSTWPAAEALDTVEKLSRLDVVLTSDQAAEAIRAAADLDGVQSVELAGGPSESAPATAEPPLSAEPTPAPDDKTAPAAATLAPATPVPMSAEEASTPAGDRARPKGTETMRVDIDRLDNLLNLAGELVVNRARFVQVSRRVGGAFERRNTVVRARDFGESLRRTIEHLQSLGDANGELTHDIEELKAGLALIEEQNELWERGRKGFAQISEALDQLTRISDSLQQGVLDTRMVPVGPLFSRFKRVVRDLSAECGKKVNLSIRGEKTELDKRMIDELGDPLVHLVRNSIDHGLEPPDVRLARGKPEAGTVSLEASHSGNNVFITIRDDGGGIELNNIKARIAERGLLDQTAIDELTDEQALDYIWHPGFSTAKEVSDISGRGVGMDAVRTRIGELNGAIEIESVPGQGATFTIRLPLTLAIINSLLTRVHSVIVSIPIDDVREIVKVSPTEVVTIHDRDSIDVRGEYIPLISITGIFDWNNIGAASTASSTPDQSADQSSDSEYIDAVVLQVGDRIMALRVDELLGSQEIVIKSLSENFVHIRGLSGASILGDGTVCLMLDVSTSMDLAVARLREKEPNLDRTG